MAFATRRLHRRLWNSIEFLFIKTNWINLYFQEVYVKVIKIFYQFNIKKAHIAKLKEISRGLFDAYRTFRNRDHGYCRGKKIRDYLLKYDSRENYLEKKIFYFNNIR